VRRFAFLIAVALILTPPLVARADPFSGGHNAPATDVASAPPGWFGGTMAELAGAQRRLNASISTAFRAVEDQHSRSALALILALSFLYGALHAIGPGHGKSVVASYFVSRHARWTSGIVMGSMISVIQGITAIVLVGLLALILEWKQFDILNRTTLVEFISYGMIAVLGLVMFYRAATGKLHAHAHAEEHIVVPDHGHDHHQHGHGHGHGHRNVGQARAAKLDRRLIVATGLTPCASAIIILLFALANNALGLGIVAVTALTAGMALTISAIGVMTVLGRRALLAMVDNVGIESHRVERPLAVVAAAAIVVISGLMMYGAWLRL
jgi:nickel/cobalt transporter (NicO) family protein